MTMPMSLLEKKHAKKTVFKTVLLIEKEIELLKQCLLVAGENEFDNDCMIIAKNTALSVCNSTQNIEHILHEIIDAPLVVE